MGVVIRQSFKATIVSYIGAFLGGILTIFIYPKFLSPELIGLSRILLDTAIFLAFFAQLGLPNVMIRFYPAFKKKKLTGVFFSLVMLLPLLSFVLIGSLFLLLKSQFIHLFSKNSATFTQYYYFIIPLALFCIYQNILETYSANLLRITIPKIIREIVTRVLMAIAIIAFAVYNLGVTNFVVMIVLVYVVVAFLNIINVLILKRNEPFSIQYNRIPKSMFKEIRTFMIFMFVFGFGSILATKIDTIMLSSMSGLSQTGIYAIAFYIATFIEIPSRSAIMIAGPVISEAMKNEEINKVDDMYKRNTIIQCCLAGIILLIIWINIDSVFKIMPNGHLYQPGKYVILFIGLSKLFDVATGINNHILIYSKFYKYSLLWILILGSLTVVSNYYLIPIYGITGAALATLFSIVLINLIVVVFIYKKLGTQPFTIGVLKLLAIFVICYVLDRFLPEIKSPYIDMIYRSSILLIVYIILLYKTMISEDINDVIRKFFKWNSFMNFIKGK